jgi:membrane-bound lytic murein transglycosylase A
VGAQGVPLTAGRSIAVDKALHVYGTPFFIQADVPVAGEKRTTGFDRLMIAQDTGSAIVGPARADIYWGAGEKAGDVAGRLRHPGRFTMLVPREIDPVLAAAQMPLPPEKPPATQAAAPVPLPEPRPSHGADARCSPRDQAQAARPTRRMRCGRPHAHTTRHSGRAVWRGLRR